MCVEGLCGEAEAADTDDTFGDNVRLDVGGGVPEIPSTCAAANLVRTTAGCEFWAADLPNAWLPGNPYAYDIAADQQFSVVVANVSDQADATVSAYAGGSTTPLLTATVGPLQTHTFDLPARSIDPERNGGGEAYRIESDVPITAYQFQPLDNLVPVYSNDASALLPAHVLEDDYMAITGRSVTVSLYPDGFDARGFNAGAFVTAIATENDTRVTFYPTSVLASGEWSGVLLHRGQTFTILSDVHRNDPGSLDPTGNLSGTRVIADKPIALFSGNVITTEPVEGTGCCADHLEHQMLPLVAWGHRYVVAPPPDPFDVAASDPATYRITAAFNGTALSYPGGKPAGAPDRLDAGQTVAFTTASPVVVVSDADHPIAVTQFLLSAEEANANGRQGDPAMVAIPSLEQHQSRYVFISPSGYRMNAVDVVAEQGATVELDGQALDGWTPLPAVDGVTYAYARRTLEPGAHVLISDRPAGLTVFGYDEFVSYGYSGGSAIDRISTAPPAP